MNYTEEQTVAIFNEWAKRYAENTDNYFEILDAEGNPVQDYGTRCIAYVKQLAKEMYGI